MIGELPSGPVDVAVECPGPTLRSVLGWWDPYQVYAARWVTLCRAATVLAPGENSLRLALAQADLHPPLRLLRNPLATRATGGRVAATRLLPNGNPEGTPRARSMDWDDDGLAVALPPGTFVFELLEGDVVTSWTAVDYNDRELTATWPGVSRVDPSRLEGLGALQALTAWHSGRRIPWLEFRCGAAPRTTWIDGAYQPTLAGGSPDGSLLVVIAGGETAIRRAGR